MITKRQTSQGDERYLVRVTNGDFPRRNLGTYRTLERAKEVEAEACNRQIRRCAGCELQFRPTSPRQVRCKPNCGLDRRNPTLEDGDHWLYRCYDSAGDLLYIGVTSVGVRRFQRHGNERPWWNDVANIEIVHFETQLEVLDAEAREIAERQPKHNRRGLSGTHVTSMSLADEAAA